MGFGEHRQFGRRSHFDNFLENVLSAVHAVWTSGVGSTNGFELRKVADAGKHGIIASAERVKPGWLTGMEPYFSQSEREGLSNLRGCEYLAKMEPAPGEDGPYEHRTLVYLAKPSHAGLFAHSAYLLSSVMGRGAAAKEFAGAAGFLHAKIYRGEGGVPGRRIIEFVHGCFRQDYPPELNRNVVADHVSWRRRLFHQFFKEQEAEGATEFALKVYYKRTIDGYRKLGPGNEADFRKVAEDNGYMVTKVRYPKMVTHPYRSLFSLVATKAHSENA